MAQLLIALLAGIFYYLWGLVKFKRAEVMYKVEEDNDGHKHN